MDCLLLLQEVENLQKPEVLYVQEIYLTQIKTQRGFPLASLSCTTRSFQKQEWVAGINNKTQLESNKTPDRQLLSILWRLMYLLLLFICFGGHRVGPQYLQLWEYMWGTTWGSKVWGLLALQALMCVTPRSCTRKRKEASLPTWNEGISLFSSKQEIRFH